jgi:hypothetical protein
LRRILVVRLGRRKEGDVAYQPRHAAPRRGRHAAHRRHAPLGVFVLVALVVAIGASLGGMAWTGAAFGATPPRLARFHSTGGHSVPLRTPGCRGFAHPGQQGSAARR